MTLPAIEPGLMVVHGNRLEDLRDLLAGWLARAPLAPLEEEQVLVQSNGIAQWLQLAMARPRSEDGLGISAAMRMQLPGRFLWSAYRAVLGHAAVPEASPFDKTRLIWRLLRLIPGHLHEGAFAPLRDFLGDDPDGRKHYQLAERVADLFDQYQVYRADWLDDWEHGDDILRDDLRGRTGTLDAEQRWQPLLWRLLLDDVGPGLRRSHRAAVHRDFLARMHGPTARPAGLPRRIVVFGISSLPSQTLEALAALGQACQVLLLVTNPCRHYWADIIEDRELLRAEQRRQHGKPGLPDTPQYQDLHLHANPLLAAWGRQGRDYVRLLDAFDRPEGYRDRFDAWGRSIDLFRDYGEDNLLHQVQQAVLDLEPLPADPAQRKPVRADDTSLGFHVAHNPQREVEILHDRLLAMFEDAERAGRPLAPGDVMVMVPDIQAYAPHIRAVFGRLPEGDPRRLPFSVADQPARGASPLAVALERLLALPDARFAVGEILDLLDVPALRRRFGLDDAGLPLLHRWIEGAGIRWGLDGAHKASLELPALDANSWRFGLRRMLLGYAAGDGASWQGIAPYGEVGGLDAYLVGPLDRLLERLEHSWQLLRETVAPEAWGERLHALLDDFFEAADGDDAARLERLRDTLDAWLQACAEAGFAQPVPLALVRENWLAALDERRLSQRFLSGAVSFGTLMPMRAIPFRVICLLGMDDGAYPRRQNAADFDLMALPGHARPGDRSRREDDRYLFLEALLSARDALHVSWVGRSARDNSALPPSVLVGQLRDYLAAGWRLAQDAPGDHQAGARLLAALTTEHPLQAFSRRYFLRDGAPDPRVFTYAREWQQARQAIAAADAGPLSGWTPEAPLGLAQLGGFLERPVRYFFNQRLHVFLPELQAADQDNEPFALDGLQHYQAAQALLEAALGEPDDPAGAVARAERMLGDQGLLPPGGFGMAALDAVARRARGAIEAWREDARRWPQAADKFELHYQAHGLTIEDWLADLRRRDDGGHVRLLPTVSQLVQGRHVRHDRLLRAWCVHLAANAAGLRVESRLHGPDERLLIAELPAAQAGELLDALLQALRQGMQAPLPVARQAAYAWLQADPDKPGAAMTAASNAYEGSDYGPRGEAEQDPHLARAWPRFAAMHAAGFADWLHLYRPLLDAVRREH